MGLALAPPVGRLDLQRERLLEQLLAAGALVGHDMREAERGHRDALADPDAQAVVDRPAGLEARACLERRPSERLGQAAKEARPAFEPGSPIAAASSRAAS